MDPVQHSLAPAGSTGTRTTEAHSIPSDAELLTALLTVEAIGATPTISWKLQTSVDGLTWADARYVDDATETVSSAVKTRTTVGADAIHVKLADRGARFFRLVVTANTNVTYRAEAHLLDRDNA